MPKLTQAMLLAAGLSTRVRPLTDTIPKPLLPFWHKTILDFSLTYLKHHGVEACSMNVHHGRDSLLSFTRGDSLQIKPMTFEEDPILGTGGGIQNMKSFIHSDHFVVANCDFMTDVDLNEAFEFHLNSKSLATMILIESDQRKKYGAIGVNESNQIVEFPYGVKKAGAKKFGLFSGIHIFHKKVFDWMPQKKIFDINRDVYPQLLEKGETVLGYLSAKRWLDVGETKLYAETQFELMKSPFAWMKPLLSDMVEHPKGIWRHPSATVHPTAQLRSPVWIGPEVSIAENCEVGPEAVLCGRNQLAPNSNLRRGILHPGHEVSKGARIENKIVTRDGLAVDIPL